MNFIYGLVRLNPDGSEWWEVHCSEKRSINASSELACQKIINLSKWLLGETKVKPLNQHILERKALWLTTGQLYPKQECWKNSERYIWAQRYKEYKANREKNKTL